jgi:hypothetical protein
MVVLGQHLSIPIHTSALDTELLLLVSYCLYFTTQANSWRTVLDLSVYHFDPSHHSSGAMIYTAQK